MRVHSYICHSLYSQRSTDYNFKVKKAHLTAELLEGPTLGLKFSLLADGAAVFGESLNIDETTEAASLDAVTLGAGRPRVDCGRNRALSSCLSSSESLSALPKVVMYSTLVRFDERWRWLLDRESYKKGGGVRILINRPTGMRNINPPQSSKMTRNGSFPHPRSARPSSWVDPENASASSWGHRRRPG